MKFNNSYQNLGPDFSQEVKSEPLRQAKWLIHSPAAFQALDVNSVHPGEWLSWLNGESHKIGDQRRSQVYAGHQFGVWAGQLGDGRALSLGEVVNIKNERWEIQTKGSGMTPFSRFADGKAVLRSCVREFLASEALFCLGIPTTRALAVLTGEGLVQRETMEKEAVCVRLLPTNVRFGTFEWFACRGDQDSLQKLSRYCTEVLLKMPELSLRAFFAEVVSRTAKMLAHWQAFGFCHGVMNTDNMSILGVTLDYGPYGFMENTDLNYICNHSDHQGRYSYGNQPAVALWNLKRLAAVFHFMDENLNLEPELARFILQFEEKYFALMSSKLGIGPGEPTTEKREVIVELLQQMQKQNLDFTSTFQKFSTEDWQNLEDVEWLKRYEKLRLVPGQKNPRYVLKNYVAERAIRAIEDHQDKSVLEMVFEVLQAPYTERAGLEWWSGPSPENERCLSVSCSS